MNPGKAARTVLIAASFLMLMGNAGCLMRRVVADGVAYGALELLLDNAAVIDLIPDG